MSVVVVTDAHGPAATLGREATVERGLGDAEWMGEGLPHDDTATTVRVATTLARTLALRTIRAPSSVRMGDGTRQCRRLSQRRLAAPHQPLRQWRQVSRAGAPPSITVPAQAGRQPGGRVAGVTRRHFPSGSNASMSVTSQWRSIMSGRQMGERSQVPRGVVKGELSW